MRGWRIAVLLLAAAWCGACGSGEGGKGEETSKQVGKGDCPDCDPKGPGAFEQAGMGLAFYKAGDAWSVAYQFKVRNDMDREALRAEQLPDDPGELPMVQEERQLTVSAPYLFEYAVTRVERQVVEEAWRDVALIRVVQGSAAGGGAYSQERLDTHEFALEFELDDLLRPRSETFYNVDYPNGKTVEVDRESSLSSIEGGSNLFPHVVPRVLVTAAKSAAPVMTAELEGIADQAQPDWRSAEYRSYQFPNGDRVYWRAGYVWPFFVECQQGYGLLVSQTLAAR